jgi:hypothetical protein
MDSRFGDDRPGGHVSPAEAGHHEEMSRTPRGDERIAKSDLDRTTEGSLDAVVRGVARA